MENFRVVNLFLEKNKTKRIEKIPGNLIKTPREDRLNIYISDFGIPYATTDSYKSDNKALFIYVHDCTLLGINVLNKQQLKFFKLDCLELTRKHIENVFLADDDYQLRERCIVEYHKKLYSEYKKIGVEHFLPFKPKKIDIIKKLLIGI